MELNNINKIKIKTENVIDGLKEIESEEISIIAEDSKAIAITLVDGDTWEQTTKVLTTISDNNGEVKELILSKLFFERIPNFHETLEEFTLKGAPFHSPRQSAIMAEITDKLIEMDELHPSNPNSETNTKTKTNETIEVIEEIETKGSRKIIEREATRRERNAATITIRGIEKPSSWNEFNWHKRIDLKDIPQDTHIEFPERDEDWIHISTRNDEEANIILSQAKKKYSDSSWKISNDAYDKIRAINMNFDPRSPILQNEPRLKEKIRETLELVTAKKGIVKNISIWQTGFVSIRVESIKIRDTIFENLQTFSIDEQQARVSKNAKIRIPNHPGELIIYLPNTDDMTIAEGAWKSEIEKEIKDKAYTDNYRDSVLYAKKITASRSIAFAVRDRNLESTILLNGLRLFQWNHTVTRTIEANTSNKSQNRTKTENSFNRTTTQTKAIIPRTTQTNTTGSNEGAIVALSNLSNALIKSTEESKIREEKSERRFEAMEKRAIERDGRMMTFMKGMMQNMTKRAAIESLINQEREDLRRLEKKGKQLKKDLKKEKELNEQKEIKEEIKRNNKKINNNEKKINELKKKLEIASLGTEQIEENKQEKEKEKSTAIFNFSFAEASKIPDERKGSKKRKMEITTKKITEENTEDNEEETNDEGENEDDNEEGNDISMEDKNDDENEGE